MAKVEGFDFFPLHFDGDGALEAHAELDALTGHIAAAGSTDLITIAHGFRNSESEATGLYTEFLKNFRAHVTRPELASLASRMFVVAAVFWPSKAFAEGPQDKEGGTASLADAASERQGVEDQLRHLLDGMKLTNVKVEETTLGDHYDPEAKVVRLSPQHFGGHSLSAVVVAAPRNLHGKWLRRPGPFRHAASG